MTPTKAMLLLLAVGGALMLQHYYALMPDPMASHFDGAGRPNGFQSRDGFFALSGAMLLLVILIFGGAHMLFRVLPTRWVNLPNREYWLAPERREPTVAFIVRQMEWFGIATMLLLIVTLKMACDANRTADRRLDSASMWWALGLYFAFTGGWLFRFFRRFRRMR